MPELGQLAAVRMAEQARAEDFQRQGQVALADKGRGGGDECVRLSPGEQVESRRCFFLAARVEAPSVWLPVAGVLVIKPGDSLMTTTSLPIFWPTSTAAASVSSSVSRA